MWGFLTRYGARATNWPGIWTGFWVDKKKYLWYCVPKMGAEKYQIRVNISI